MAKPAAAAPPAKTVSVSQLVPGDILLFGCPSTCLAHLVEALDDTTFVHAAIWTGSGNVAHVHNGPTEDSFCHMASEDYKGQVVKVLRLRNGLNPGPVVAAAKAIAAETKKVLAAAPRGTNVYPYDHLYVAAGLLMTRRVSGSAADSLRLRALADILASGFTDGPAGPPAWRAMCAAFVHCCHEQAAEQSKDIGYRLEIEPRVEKRSPGAKWWGLKPTEKRELDLVLEVCVPDLAQAIGHRMERAVRAGGRGILRLGLTAKLVGMSTRDGRVAPWFAWVVNGLLRIGTPTLKHSAKIILTRLDLFNEQLRQLKSVPDHVVSQFVTVWDLEHSKALEDVGILSDWEAWCAPTSASAPAGP